MIAAAVYSIERAESMGEWGGRSWRREAIGGAVRTLKPQPFTKNVCQ